ncbi:Fe2+-dependent dioxygenase [Ottowia thiooxydans]|uniref:Fe2+-dependent dioxygenase n=1 Tax=Ottowia thiooxydans TaxID=219182 RepID=UPI000490F2A9|nr:Fe2+-dependent dioxygenase [Ottowia thiooxydans]
MMLVIPDVLSHADLADIRSKLETASWQDGRETAGYAAIQQKSNEQLRATDPLAIQLGERILGALSCNPRFISFALPRKIFSPMFNRYQGGGEYGLHVDNSIRIDAVSGERIRTDISTTVFLNEPADYEGGELVVSDTYGVKQVKLPAGHAVVYPGSSLHRVTPVTRGRRLASFFWTESMVRDDARRSMLFELDNAIQALAHRAENGQEVGQLTGVYHNLMRQWADS